MRKISLVIAAVAAFHSPVQAAEKTKERACQTRALASIAARSVQVPSWAGPHHYARV